MRVLQVITSLLIGGAEHLVVQLVERLREQGIETDVCLFDGERTAFYDELTATGCKIYSLSEQPRFYDVRYIYRLRNIMRHYDIIHTHNSAPQLFTALANIGLGRKLVTTEHNTDNRKRGHWYLACIDRWMYRCYDTIICISDQAEINLRQYLKTEGHFDDGGTDQGRMRVKTIYNGIEVDRFHDAQPLTSKHRERFIIAMVAAFRPQKDQATLVRALSLLPHDEYELWLVGTGAELSKVGCLAEQLGISDRVRFWGVRSDVPQILHAADVVCMSSHYEGLSLSSIEGMAVGKPFVASDVDGLREVTQGYGVLVPHEDAQALASVIRHLHDDREYAQRVADKCYERARQFDIMNTVDGYAEIYGSLMK